MKGKDSSNLHAMRRRKRNTTRLWRSMMDGLGKEEGGDGADGEREFGGSGRGGWDGRGGERGFSGSGSVG